MSILIWSLWALQIFAKLVTGSIIARRGLAGRYWGLMIWLLVGAGKSAMLACIRYSHGVRAYTDAWQAFKPLDYALSGILICTMLYAVASHYGKPRGVFALMTIFGMFAAFATLFTAHIGIPEWTWAYRWTLNWSKNWNMFAFLMAAGVITFYGGPVSRNTRKLRTAVLAVTAADYVSYLVMRWSAGAYWWVAGAQVCLQLGPVVACAMVGGMRGNGEERPERDILSEQAARRMVRIKSIAAGTTGTA